MPDPPEKNPPDDVTETVDLTGVSDRSHRSDATDPAATVDLLGDFLTKETAPDDSLATGDYQLPPDDSLATGDYNLSSDVTPVEGGATVDLPHSRVSSATQLDPPEQISIAGVSIAGIGDGKGYSPDAPTQPAPLAMRLGRFRVVRTLGSGAFGTVFLTRDVQLDRQVAIKVAKPGILSDAEESYRFLREARAAAQLRHPHIVPVYEFGTVDETNYIAYQYIRGETLRDWIKKQTSVDIPKVVDITSKLAGALGYAHSYDIVHRDIKPENILIDEAGEPHVADFGCARREEGTGMRTIEGSVMGTPAYMSPEQASGRSHEADGRADIWSVGVMMYEMLTGERPFKGSITELLVHINETQHKSVRQHNKAIPRDLETIVDKCMTKDREARFKTAEDLQAELARWQRGEPILSRPIGILGRTWRLAKRNPAVASLVLLVLAITTLAALVSTNLLLATFRAQRETAIEKVGKLETANPASVPDLLGELSTSRFRGNVLARLETDWNNRDLDAVLRHRAGLGLLALQPNRREGDPVLGELKEAILTCEPAEFPPLRSGLKPYARQLVDDLWRVATDLRARQESRLRAAAALASYDPTSDQWPGMAPDVRASLLRQERIPLAIWTQELKPIRQHLRESLLDTMRNAENEKNKEKNGETAASIVADLFADDPEFLVELTTQVSPKAMANLFVGLEQNKAEAVTHLNSQLANELGPTAIANIELALLRLQQPARFLQRLATIDDPTVRTLVLQGLVPAGTDATFVLDQLANPQNDGIQLAGLLLGLGEYTVDALPEGQRNSIRPLVVELLKEHPSSAVHSSATWLLRQWNFGDSIVEVHQSLASLTPIGKRQWRVNNRGELFVILGPDIRYRSGSPDDELGHSFSGDEREDQVDRTIDYRFEISATEVSEGQFAAFEAAWIGVIKSELKTLEAAVADDDETSKKRQIENLKATINRIRMAKLQRSAEFPDRPMTNVSWNEAAAYLRWLGDQEGIADSEQGYPGLVEIAAMEDYKELSLRNGFLQCTGYRLPTAVEWEYACRGGSTTIRSMGTLENTMDDYCWSLRNSDGHAWPIGQLRPNNFGLFDMLGNAAEWCQNDFFAESADAVKRAEPYKEFRGGDYSASLANTRSASRHEERTFVGFDSVSFRAARTLPAL